MSKLAKALTAAAGNAGESLYVEDVFSTYLYEGNGSTQTITNGIDLDGEGGLVWLQGRTSATGSRLDDTERPLNDHLRTFSTEAPITYSVFSSLNSDGFSLVDSNMNSSGADYASWTFRKAEKFFDVVTYTGDGTNGRQISHSLGSVPGMVICKSVSGISTWAVKHISSPSNEGQLNSTAAFAGYGNFPTSYTGFTDSYFTVDAGGSTNSNGATYVAYLFASDAGGFGDDGSESIIKCGSFTGNGSTDGPVIDLGFEPQWVMIKRASASGTGWYMHDIMRGMPNGGTDSWLEANSSAAEVNSIDWIHPTANGFKITNTQTGINASGNTYIYIAIRRPMKTPESGTEVFSPVARTGTGAVTQVDAGFAVDLSISSERGTVFVGDKLFFDRLRGANVRLTSTGTAAESSSATDMLTAFTNTGVTLGADANWYINKSGNPYINWFFKRATGFFDVVAYTGDGVAGRTVNHSLGVAPELMIVKVRDSSTWGWAVYAKPLGTGILQLQDNGDYVSTADWFNNTHPTDSVFYVSDQARTNLSGGSLIAYLFATLAGVSKVGSYTGTGSNVDVDCGFSAGARFILIKRTDSTGDWYVWDSVRGIVAGNDPYLLLNSTAAEVTSTDYIDPLSSGFTVTSSAPAALNASGGTYIFMAIS